MGCVTYSKEIVVSVILANVLWEIKLSSQRKTKFQFERVPTSSIIFKNVLR